MFLTVCSWLSGHRLSWLVFFLRYLLLRTVARRVLMHYYDRPENVGYLGWVSHPAFGALAMMKRDGTLQVRW